MPEMLTADERNDVFDLLIRELSNGDCRQTLANALPPELSPRLDANGSCSNLVWQAIRICEDDGHRTSPPSIHSFLSTLLRVLGLAAPSWWNRLMTALATPPPPIHSPYEDLLIRGDVPFLDRGHLRTELKALLKRRAERAILVVNGPRHCGKSFTARLIDHVCWHTETLRHCLVAVTDEHNQPTVLDVARDMMAKLGGDATRLPAAHTNEARWPQDLANAVWYQVIEASRGWDGQWVLILDGFNAARLDQQIARFVLQLIDNMRTGVATHHRLVLTDFDDSVLAKLRNDVRKLTLDGMPGPMMRAELADLLRQVGRQGDAGDLIEEVMKGVADPLEDLRDFGARCEEIVTAIRV